MNDESVSWTLTFGPYRVCPAEKLLLRDGEPVKLGSRAFDLLVALAQHPGKVMGQRELMAIVWRKTIVEESSLRVQLRLLRKALGDGRHGARYIATISGRGYCFVAPTAIHLPSSRVVQDAITHVPSFKLDGIEYVSLAALASLFDADLIQRLGSGDPSSRHQRAALPA